MSEDHKEKGKLAVHHRIEAALKGFHFNWELLIAFMLVLFLSLLPFHLVIKKLLPGPVGTYWKEGLLGLMVVAWGGCCLSKRRLLVSNAPLEIAVIIYMGLLVLRFALDRSGWVGAWGLYISVMYLPLFWLVNTVLRRYPSMSKILIWLMVGVGGCVALGGLVEFIFDVTLWPSIEMVTRQGFPDVFVYGTHLRRVYFVFDSPTTLANTLALILPLAITSIWLVRSRRIQVIFGLTAAIIVACIVVTFSRGIWIATLLSFLLVGIWIGVSVKRSRAWLFVSGIAVLAGSVLGMVLLSRASKAALTDKGVVELSPQLYRNLPIAETSLDLLENVPDHGQKRIQFWSILDPITRQLDERTVLYEHPSETGKEEIVYRFVAPEAGALRFAIALSPEVWSPEMGDGARFQIFVAPQDKSEPGRFIFNRYINPKINPSDRRWRNFLVDLSPWSSKTIDLSLTTEQGPVNDWAYDWAGWSELQVVSLPPDYFSTQVGENAAWNHITSILDWVGDETNRDRLAAWSTSMSSWLDAPLWGKGLGTTGVAALRTQPERAYVTESQVLKALTELGGLGLLALLFLWFQIARVGYLVLADKGIGQDRRILLVGIMTSLLIIFIEGIVYQNLEVKQVNAYFWTLVGILAFQAWSFGHDTDAIDPHS